MATVTDLGATLRAKFFRGFADPSRLALLDALRGGEQTVGQLVAATGLSQSNVSGHLACLRDCGLVAGRQEWRHVFYRLADPRIVELLGAADGILAENASRIYACVNVPETQGAVVSAGAPRDETEPGRESLDEQPRPRRVAAVV